MWDSNLFRLPTKDAAQAQLGTSATGTTMNRLDAGIDTDIPISRQRFITHLNVNKSNFERFSFLNYTGHDILAKWQWRAGNLWHGELGYSTQKTLASYNQFQSPVKNLVTQSKAFVDADYSFYPHWHLRAGANRYQVGYSADLQHTNNVTIDTATAGINFVSRADNSLGLQLKAVDGRYPNRQVVATSVVDNSYRQTDVNVIARWSCSAVTRLRGRLGYVGRSYHQLSVRDFNGVVGDAHVDWRLAGATVLDLAAWRRISAYQNLISSYVITNGTSLTPTWTVTSKVTFTGQLLYETLSYQGDPGFLLSQKAVRNDVLKGIRIEVDYEPFTKMTLGASYQWQYRTSNYSTNRYRDNMVDAHLRLDFL